MRQDAVQVVLCDPHYWGGVRQIQHLSRLCQAFGFGLSMHSNSHLGVSLMAMTHAAAAAPHLTYACDTHYPWQSRGDEVVAGGRVRFVDGCVEIPDRPGLGVDLDPDRPRPRPRTLCAVSLPQARRRGGDAQARRSDVDAPAAAMVSIHASMTPSELRSRLTGVVGFPVTPFSDALTVDLDGLRHNVEVMARIRSAASSQPAAPASCTR